MGNKLIVENKYKEAIEMVQTASQIILNLGGPYNNQLASCYVKLAQIYCKMNDYAHAVIMQKNAVEIYE